MSNSGDTPPDKNFTKIFSSGEIVDSVKGKQAGVNLNDGNASPVIIEQAAILRESWDLRREQRRRLFRFCLAFIGLLTLAFIAFAGIIACMAFTEKNFDWHLLMIGSTLIIPPTVLLFLLASRIYQSDHHQQDQSKEEKCSTPAEQTVKTVGELIKSLGELLTKSEK